MGYESKDYKKGKQNFQVGCVNYVSRRGAESQRHVENKGPRSDSANCIGSLFGNHLNSLLDDTFLSRRSWRIFTNTCVTTEATTEGTQNTGGGSEGLEAREKRSTGFQSTFYCL